MKRTNRKNSIFNRRDFIRLSGLSAGALALGSLGHIPKCFAKEIYPADKVTFILPHKAGGGYDIYIRGLSPYLSKYLKAVVPGAKGGDVVVRNEPASAGRKAYSILFNAKPDGYTLSLIDTTPITDSISEKMEFDFPKLSFILAGSATTEVIVTSKKGFTSWNEAVEAMKKNPIKTSVGSFGRALHISAILTQEKLKTNLKMINFPGQAESINSLLRGDTQLAVCSEDAIQPLVEAGELKVLLIFDDESRYPGAINIKQLGYPELIDILTFYRFIVAPPGLSEEPRNILTAALKRANTDKEFLSWAAKAQFELKQIYGSDAQKLFVKYAQTIEDLKPVLKKYLS